MSPEEMRAGLDEFEELLQEYRELDEEAHTVADELDSWDGMDADLADELSELHEQLDDLLEQILELADALGISDEDVH